MSWSIARTYARANPAAERLIESSGKRYVRLAPPAVSVPLLVLGDQVPPKAMKEEHRAWASTATVPDAEALCARVPDVVQEYHCVPDRESLLAAKWFAEKADTAVVAYGAETWGSGIEYEWCWFFGRGGDRVQVLASRRREVEQVWWHLFRRPRVRYERSVIDFTADTHTARAYAGMFSILADAMSHLGVSAAGGFFPPHERGFDWQQYKVRPALG